MKHGHDVALGTRDVAKLAEFAAAHPTARIGSTAEAAAFAELAVLAVKSSAALETLRGVAAQLTGKTVVDTCNPIADAPPTDGVLSYFTGPNDSLLEQLQREFKAVKLVKAFSSVGTLGMVNPKFTGGPPTMFIAGDDAAAKAAVTRYSRSSVGRPPTWALPSPPGQSSHCACCGAFRASWPTTGCTPSRCCA